MSEALQQFHFLHPWWLLSLVALPLLAWLGLRPRAAQVELSRLVDARLLPHLLRGRAANRQLPLWLFLAGWTLCALAMAGPAWNRSTQPLYANRAAQVLAISLSRHMLARDVAPSRIDRARYKAHDLLDANRDGLNALIGYAGEAFVVAPLTADAHSLGDLLDAMAPDTMPVDGNDAASAIERGAALIHDAKAGGGSLVLITDQADAAAAAAARKANAAGVRVSVLGVGTPQGGPVPSDDGGFLRDAGGGTLLAHREDAALQVLASAGGGRYIAMTTDRRDIDALHGELQASSTTTKAEGQLGDEWQDRGPWLLLPLLLVVAMAFRRGWLLLLPLACLPLLPATAEATTWNDLWRRPDQQAVHALRQGDAKQAQKLAREPAWRGAAAYRAGDYADSARALQRAPGSDAAYNLGNAYAKQGQYQPAIEAYDHALKLDPSNNDAKANRKAVADWMHRQPPKPQQNRQGENGASNPSPSSGSKQDKAADQSKSQDAQSAQEQGKPSEQPGKDGQSKGQDGKGAEKPAGQDDGNPPKPPSPQQQAEQKAQQAQAQKALRQQMDEALGAARKPNPGKPSTHQLGTASQDDPQSKLPADLRHALQRVPDDPGALLRRKFQLEYQQRHGAAPGEDDPP